MEKALITDIQRFSIHDGPGIRTTVFFKGCPLRCLWCHNPETIRFENEPVYTVRECIGCGDCVKACPQKALKPGAQGIECDYSLCRQCLGLACAEVCPSGARSPAAKAYDADALLCEVMRDKDFYGDDGGITLSGGEPLAHPEFLKEFLPKARAGGLHVAAETCGYWSPKSLGPVLGLIDLYLFDIKVVDAGLHEALTGKPNKLILENLKMLVSRGHSVWMRMPFVPGKNDGEENLGQTADLAASLGLNSVWLLPYHAMGESKLLKINPPVPPLNLPPPTQGQMAAAGKVFASCGIDALSQ